MKQALNLETLNTYVNISCYMLLESILFGPELLSSRFLSQDQSIVKLHNIIKKN
jgi:hypothetical protein